MLTPITTAESSNRGTTAKPRMRLHGYSHPISTTNIDTSWERKS